MTQATISLSAIPSTLGAWDRMVNRAREQRLDNDRHDTERTAEVARLAEAFEDGMSDDVRAPALFARLNHRGEFQSIADVLFDAIDSEALRIAFAGLVMDAALGLPVTDKAAALIQQAGKRFADNEVEA
jgi:hypothetical protein